MSVKQFKRLMPYGLAMACSLAMAQAAQAEAGGIALSGVIEVEATYNDDEIADEITSDIALATVEVAADAQLNKAVSGHLLFLYEDGQGDDNVLMDEAVITLHMPRSPFYVSAGRQYVPFGNFETMMVSDPLTLELGETREDALLLGLESGGLYGSLYVFNGDADKAEINADRVNDFGANAGYAVETKRMNLDLGVSYINNIADSDTIQEAMPAGGIQRHSGGLSAHLVLGSGRTHFMAEYLTATKTIKQVDLAFKGKSAKVSAMNLELGVDLRLGGKPATLAVAHQQSGEALDLGLPESRNLLALSVELTEGTTLALEYATAEDYAVADGGTGKDATGFTAQLGLEF